MRSRSEHLLWAAIETHLERGDGNRAALRRGDRTIDYSALATMVAHGATEIDQTFPAGSRIAIAGRDQLEVAVAFLATLASRSVPLLADPQSPARLGEITREWSVAGIVGTAPPSPDVRELPAGWLERWAAVSDPPGMPLVPVAATDPAFWTFTSGTTGRPRAVVHSHGGPRAAFSGFGASSVGYAPHDVVIATAGLPFVYATGNALFFPLMAGASTVLPGDLLLPNVLGELARQNATVLVSGPWSLEAIVRLARRDPWQQGLRGLRLVLSAGERLPGGVFDAWEDAFGHRIIDNLGCTEMFNSFVSCPADDVRRGTLGGAVPGFELRVGGSAAEPGAEGALEVRGASRAIALSSRDTPGLLSPNTDEWCATGDAVRVDEHGDVVFVGRLDDRFKVRGQFVHPVEVECILQDVPGIAECLVEATTDGRELAEVGVCIVATPDAEEAEVRRAVAAHARTHLPSHARPRSFRFVDALPRSPRGKKLRTR